MRLAWGGRHSVALAGLLAVAGCNCGGPTQANPTHHPDGGAPDGGRAVDAGHPASTLTSLSILPADEVLTISGSTPATATYTATGTYSDGHTADVTAQTTFSLQSSTLGSFSGAEFTSTTTQGGTTSVTGQVGFIEGSTSLTLKLSEQLSDPGDGGVLPANASSLFTGSATMVDGGSQLVYPNDGVLLPPNLGKLELHFLPGDDDTVFELSFENAITDVKIITTCATPLNGGCVYLPDPSVWSWLANTNRGGDPLTVSIRGTDAQGTLVDTSPPIHISFSYDNLSGGIYYWTTSGDTAIMRFDFGSTTQTAPQEFANPTLTGGTCVGCHALSHDGARLVAEAGGQNDGRLLLMDVATQMPLVPFPADGSNESIFESWNPDAGSFVGVYADTSATDYNLLLFNGSTALPESPADIPGTGTQQNPADHPDWSADGTKIAFVKVGIAQTCQRMFQGAIEMIQGQLDGGWSAPEELVPSVVGMNRYYPAWAPDSSFLIFDQSTCSNPASPDMSCDADTDASATLFAIPGIPGSNPVLMVNANTPGVMDRGTTQLTDTFPKWSPFVFQRTSELGSKLMWVTFSSTRQFGLRSPPAAAAGGENPSGTFIWMAAVDPDRLGNGADPSYPAFCLPFQDTTTSNHIAQWATQVVTSTGPLPP